MVCMSLDVVRAAMRSCGVAAALALVLNVGNVAVRGQENRLAVPAKQWAIEAAQNEQKVLEYKTEFLRYEMHIVDAKGDMVRDVIESKDGPVARLIQKEGRPLTPEEDAAERERLQAMLDSPAALARHMRNEQSGKKLAAEMISQLPEAMIYSYAPGQPQREDRSADAPAEVVVDFKPNPAWNPPTMAAGALTGFEGRTWIDARTHTMTRLDGTIFRGVNFGWGFVAHIYPGGKVYFEQVRVGEQRWIFSHFVEHATVRAMMVKTIKEDSEIQGSKFTEIAAMGYQDAIHLLLARPLPSR